MKAILGIVIGLSLWASPLQAAMSGGQVCFPPLEFVREVYPLTIQTSEYTAGEALGGAVEIQFSVTVAGRSGFLQQVQVLDKSSQNAPMTIWIFADVFTPTADQAAFAVTDGEIQYCHATVDITADQYKTSANNSVATSPRLALAIAPSGTIMRFQVEIEGTKTWPSANDLSIVLYWIPK